MLIKHDENCNHVELFLLYNVKSEHENTIASIFANQLGLVQWP